MSQVIIQVIVDVPDLQEGDAERIAEGVGNLINDSGELSGEFYQEFGVTEVTTVFEDVV
jgi:hypothetical protein